MPAQFRSQTAGMLRMVMDDLELQTKQLLSDSELQCAIDENRASIMSSCGNRKAIFQLCLGLLPDDPRQRLQIMSEVLGVMVVLAGAECEHGSCFAFENIEDAIAMWSERLPLLSCIENEQRSN